MSALAEEVIERAERILQEAPDNSLRKRRLETFRLRLDGYSYSDIGDMLGTSQTVAYQDHRWCLENVPEVQETVAEFRRMAIDLLERMKAKLYERRNAGDLQATAMTIRIIDLEAKLVGAYHQPYEVDMQHWRSIQVVGEPE